VSASRLPRVVGLLALLLAVILPQLRVWYERQGWPDVAIILDDSESMSTVDRYRDAKVQEAADALATELDEQNLVSVGGGHIVWLTEEGRKAFQRAIKKSPPSRGPATLTSFLQ